jgi:hypothetical protein
LFRLRRGYSDSRVGSNTPYLKWFVEKRKERDRKREKKRERDQFCKLDRSRANCQYSNKTRDRIKLVMTIKVYLEPIFEEIFF